MPKGERWLWGVVAILVVVLTAVVGYRRLFTSPDAAVLHAISASGCDLNKGACAASLQGRGDVRFSVEPRPIPLVKPITLSVRTSVADIASVDVEFTGADMDMGYNRFHLERTADGVYAGEAMLPVCVRSRMTWQAKIILQTADEAIVATYLFDTASTH